MTAFLLVTLFATVALASVFTVADAIVRGHAAFRDLRGELARNQAVHTITVTMDAVEGPRIPALRPALLSGGRTSPRRMAPGSDRLLGPLRAAA